MWEPSHSDPSVGKHRPSPSTFHKTNASLCIFFLTGVGQGDAIPSIDIVGRFDHRTNGPAAAISATCKCTGTVLLYRCGKPTDQRGEPLHAEISSAYPSTLGLGHCGLIYASLRCFPTQGKDATTMLEKEGATIQLSLRCDGTVREQE